MKRLLYIVVAFFMILSLCSCSKASVNSGEEVTLVFNYGEQNINTVLPDDEANKILSILDGNTYNPVSSGTPSCGFDKNISLKVGGRVYAIARDTCNTIQDLGNLKYFSVTQEEIDFIHSLFEKYGGYFPCI